MRHPLMINKSGRLSNRPPMNRITILVDGYVIGTADQDDLIPGKTIKIVPNTTLTLSVDFTIGDEPRMISPFDGFRYLRGSTI